MLVVASRMFLRRGLVTLKGGVCGAKDKWEKLFLTSSYRFWAWKEGRVILDPGSENGTLFVIGKFSIITAPSGHAALLCLCLCFWSWVKIKWPKWHHKTCCVALPLNFIWTIPDCLDTEEGRRMTWAIQQTTATAIVRGKREEWGDERREKKTGYHFLSRLICS